MDHLSVAKSFGLLHRRSQALVVEKCQGIGVSYAGYGLLLTLFEHEGSSQEELSARLFMDKAVVTREIQALEANGFVTRYRDAQDKRRKRIYLTPLARAHQAFLEGVLHRWMEYLCVGMTEEEAETVQRLFPRLAFRAMAADVQTI
ncbi:MAG: MarR family winged helix-turn-helix transcriptional regulator [Schwartzia sp. (in: firmicutes)]